MFKKYVPAESIKSTAQIKNSAQRHIINNLVEQYPSMKNAADQLLPKKAILVTKTNDGVQLISSENEILFFEGENGVLYPSLRLLHKYPQIMIKMQVDKGAIRHLLSGANVMSPGFTSAGGKLPSFEVPVGTPVAIYAEGKEHAIAMGLTLLSTEDIKTSSKGVAVEIVHFVGDGLWTCPRLP